VESHRATCASFSSRPRARQPKHRQRHGALCRSKRARHAAVPSTGVWIARFHFVRRGPAFQAAQGLFSPCAGNGMAPLAAVSVQGTLPYRPKVLGERARCCIVRRWPAFQAAQGSFSSSAGNSMVPLAAISVQNALTCRLQVCGQLGVASCDLCQIFKHPRALRLRSYLDLEGRRLSSRSA
jgi:hypothetical protein